MARPEHIQHLPADVEAVKSVVREVMAG
jgi:hypothetical protein